MPAMSRTFSTSTEPSCLFQGVAGGGTHKDAHAGDGVVVMDGVHHLHQVVLAGWIVQVKVGEVGEVRLHGDPGARGRNC